MLNDDEQKSIFYTCILRRVIFELHNFILNRLGYFFTEVCVQSLIHHENKSFESYDPTQIDFPFKDMHITYFEIQHTIYATEFEDTNICPHILSP